MNISHSEMRLMELIWQKEPVKSGELAGAAFDILGWKKSTVYTVVKKLSDKKAIKSKNAVIISLVDRESVLSEESEEVINKDYGGSLPTFIAAFLSHEHLTKAQAKEIKEIIDRYTEKA